MPAPRKFEHPVAAMADPLKVVQEVLRRSALGDHTGVLKVLGDPVGPGCANAAVRKAFLRISVLIHPDKLAGCADATRAFQALVTAFDRTQKRGIPATTKVPQHKALARSNENCYRTEVLCPRCKVPWGLPNEGNPPYYYNFMMEGLRTFTCATCLLSFGCLTAVHKCPCCKQVFEYSPDMFHQQVKCGNPGCKEKFGFKMFPASEAALNEARKKVVVELEQQARAEDLKSSRAQRAARRSGAPLDLSSGPCAELAFTMGMRDTCPRCGLELEDMGDGDQLRHLRSCTNTAAHREHKQRVQAKAVAAKSTALKHQAQVSAASLAAFNMNGGHAEDLWMLDDEQLRKRCSLEGVSATGKRITLIDRLADKISKRQPLDRKRPLADHMPKNLYAQSNDQLAAVCASHRVRGASTKEERLEALEALLMPPAKPRLAIEGRGRVLAIEDKAKTGKAKAKAATAKAATVKAKAKAGKAKAKAGKAAKDEAASPSVATAKAKGVAAKPKAKAPHLGKAASAASAKRRRV